MAPRAVRGFAANSRVAASGCARLLHPLGEAEVHHLHVPLRGHHDVGGLQIAVQKAAGVRFLERLGDFSGQAQGLWQRQATSCEAAIKRVTRDELHHQEERALVFANFEDLADVRVIECGHRHGFVAQALPRVGVGGRVGREQFDRDPPIEAGVVGAIHLTHASRADGRENLIAAEPRAGRQRPLIHHARQSADRSGTRGGPVDSWRGAPRRSARTTPPHTRRDLSAGR